MTTKTSAAVVALLMTATVFVGIANAFPYFPSPDTGLGANPGPQFGAPCNAPGASELGYDGDALGSPNGYHTYSNTPGFAAGDYCATLNPAFFAGCTQTFVTTAPGKFLATYNNDPLPSTGGITQARRDLVTDTEEWALGQMCDGIAGTGSDGEYEFGDLTAVLDVRNASITDTIGNGGLQGGTTATKGNGVGVCINSKATDHHGDNKKITVLDVLHGSNIAFTVTGDWSRPDWLSSGGADENDAGSSTECGGDGVEPCSAAQLAAGDYGGTIPDIESGRKAASDAAGDLVDTVTANPPVTFPPLSITPGAALAADLEYFNGCNPLDWSYSAVGGTFSATNGGTDADGRTINSVGGTLAGLNSGFDTDYTAGAAGFITVNIDGAIVNADIDHVDVDVTTAGGTAGWVWTWI